MFSFFCVIFVLFYRNFIVFKEIENVKEMVRNIYIQ